MVLSTQKLLCAASAIAVAVFLPLASSAATLVTKELVLSVDISGSVSASEFALQRDGYVAAFRDPEVMKLISKIPDGVAVNFQYWATDTYAPLGWRVLTDHASSLAFANAIANSARPNVKANGTFLSNQGGTDIADAINSASNLLRNNQYEGEFLVIDVSGDGRSDNTTIRNNKGAIIGYCGYADTCSPLQQARNSAVTAGITINGLPILGDNTKEAEKYLDTYYSNNVIGGNSSFIEIANGFADINRAVKAKLIAEIEDVATVPEPATATGLLVVGALAGVIRRKR